MVFIGFAQRVTSYATAAARVVRVVCEDNTFCVSTTRPSVGVRLRCVCASPSVDQVLPRRLRVAPATSLLPIRSLLMHCFCRSVAVTGLFASVRGRARRGSAPQPWAGTWVALLLPSLRALRVGRAPFGCVGGVEVL